jgi:hypothetical protein
MTFDILEENTPRFPSEYTTGTKTPLPLKRVLALTDRVDQSPASRLI